MRILTDGTDLDRFFDELSEAPSGVLLLDYDGTLAPFREDRHQAVPYGGVRERLVRLRELVGSGEPVASPVIVSGRPAEEVQRLLGVEPVPEIWGCHGWERMDPEGRLHRLDPGEEVRGGLGLAYEGAGEIAPGGRVEHKGAAVAVHFRGMDEDRAADLEARVGSRWREIAEARSGLELRPFDGGLELRAGDRDKGSAVREILENVPKGLPLAFLGDDLTDEDAFQAVREEGGLSVLVRSSPRDTEANLWLRPPDELLAFLDRWIETVRSARGTTRGPRSSPD